MKSPLTDEEFNKLKWTGIDGRKVAQIIAGMVVVGAEPVDYPETDGLVIYLRNKQGKLLVLDITGYLCSDETLNFSISAAMTEKDV